MSAGNVDFCHAIREAVQGHGRVAGEAQVGALNEMARSLGRFDAEAMTVLFDKDDGTTETPSEWIGRQVGRLPKASASPISPDRFIGQTAAAPSLVERIRAQDEADAIAHAQALAGGPNPWSKTSFNQTKQAIIRRHLPQIAIQLKAKAVK